MTPDAHAADLSPDPGEAPVEAVQAPAFNLPFDAQDLEQLPQLYAKLREPIFSLKQTGIHSKLYVDWKKAGIATATEEQAWTRLSFLEYLWLKMARELRELGLPLARVKALREYLLADFSLAPDKISPQMLERLRTELPKTGLTVEQVQEVLQLVETGQLPDLLQQFKVSFSLLESLVYAALYKKQEAGVLLFAGGEFVPWLDEMVGLGPEGQSILEQTHVFLSTTQHLKEFILDEDKADYIPRLPLLSEEELQVLRAVRSRSFRQVTLTFDRKQGITMRTTTDGQLEEDLTKELIAALALKNYQSVYLENRGGSKLQFTKEHRRRL